MAPSMPTDPAVETFIEQAPEWGAEMATLRPILLGCGLSEAMKWRKPCFGQNGSNIAIFQPMKEHLALMFFKGVLLHDPARVLDAQGPNSRSARRIRFTSVDDVIRHTGTVIELVEEAKAVEERGLDVEPAPELELVDELRERLDADPALRAAFDALTPGRQRGYNIYVAGAKRSATRMSRVDKHVERILDGKGLHDR